MDSKVAFEVKNVPLVPTHKKVKKNVLTAIEDIGQSKGPMSILHRCVNERLRAKVWIRSSHYVRSICTGYIIAFDKHWNLAMSDVDEKYINPVYVLKNRIDNDNNNNKRRTAKKLECMKIDSKEEGDVSNNDDNNDNNNRNDNNTKIKKNENTVDNSGNVEQYLERHIDQILIRGDNVVMVAIKNII